jgi:hypothetical protein
MTNGSTWGQWYWPLCLSLIIAMVLGPEIYALITNVYNTLSWWVWQQLEVSPLPTTPWTAAHLIVLGLWLTGNIWLTGHFFWRKWT